jgi:hypothetical protein
MSRLYLKVLCKGRQNLPSKPSMPSGFEMWQVHEYPGVEGLELKVNLPVLKRVVSVLCHPFGPAVQVLEALWVGLLLAMLQHLVPRLYRIGEGVSFP